MVGWASTETYGTPDSRSRSTAQTVLAICISASTFSCMRAPPEAATETRGMPRSAATSLARVNISPTTLPIEPPMNAKSIVHSTHGMPSIVAVPAIIASPSPVATSASLRRSVYGRRSANASGSAERRSSANWRKLPGSASCSTRSSAPTGKW